MMPLHTTWASTHSQPEASMVRTTDILKHFAISSRSKVVTVLPLRPCSQKWWLKPKSGKFEKLEDLEGVIMAGTPEDIAQEVGKFIDAGIDHIVFDLRFRLHDYDYCMDLIGEEVLPLVK